MSQEQTPYTLPIMASNYPKIHVAMGQNEQPTRSCPGFVYMSQIRTTYTLLSWLVFVQRQS